MIKIYALVHPSSSKVYIGKTCRELDIRLAHHIYESTYNPRLTKNIWIRKLLQSNTKPVIELIEEVEDELGNEKEKYYIKLGWKIFSNDMLNSPLMPGGEGFQKGKNLTKESREKSAKTRRKFSNQDLENIRIRVNNGEFIKDIAKEYKVNRITIMRNLKGRVIGTENINYRKNHRRGVNHSLAKINENIANEIRKKYNERKCFQKKLAKEYNIAQSTLWSILKNKTWKN